MKSYQQVPTDDLIPIEISEKRTQSVRNIVILSATTLSKKTLGKCFVIKIGVFTD